jgi:tRNA modification GTPase
MFSTSDTIAAIATPAGRGAIGIVRASGPEAHAIVLALLGRSAPLEPRRATFGRVCVRAGGVAIGDEVVATYFPAPRSYTREDVVEVSGHGSPVVLGAILEGMLEGGARLARPGEFTFRAYINGRFDLSQAEAVGDLIEAVTPLQARVAFDQLEGSLATAIAAVERRLFDLIASLEASLDFPDEGYHFIDPHDAAREVRDVGRVVRELIARAREGRVIREGARVVIAGRANVGKSSLFNRLIDAERAIVTPVPGTTRDLVSETLSVEGVPVLLVDTAGVRPTRDEVEAEGVRRAEAAAGGATVLLLVLDRSLPLTTDDERLLAQTAGGARIVVANKADRPPAWSDGAFAAVPTSATSGQGIGELRRRVAAALGRETSSDEPPRVTNIRHARHLQEASAALSRAETLLGAPGGAAAEELVLVELHEAMAAFEGVAGRRTPDDVLEHIFSRFCVGK